jgi:tripartite-type tricarboxylate transporter receptor subunit TctC
MFTRERTAIFPTLATAQEQGLKDFTTDNWLAFFLPKRTPAAIVQKLHDAAVAALNTPAVQARLKEVGADAVAPERRSSEYLQKFVESEIVKWAEPIKAAGLVTN